MVGKRDIRVWYRQKEWNGKKREKGNKNIKTI
jgi:hypothetical protein